MHKPAPRVVPAPPPIPPVPANLAGSLLLATVITALVAVLSGLVARFIPAWRPGYLVVACMLVSIEAALVRYRMLRDKHLESGALGYLGAELFALVVLMRVVATLSLGLDTLPASVQRWLRSPLEALDGAFVACLLSGLVAALLVRGGLRALAELEARPSLQSAAHDLDMQFYRAVSEAQERAALAQIAGWLAWGGGVVLLALVAQVVNLQQFGGSPAPLPASVALAGVAYLGGAILLFSRGRLGLLRSRWQRDGAEIEAEVPRRWRLASLVSVLGVVFVTLVLPRSYGLGMLDALRSGAALVLNLISLVALFIGALAVGAVGVILTIPALLLALLAGNGPAVSLPPATLPTPVASPPPRLPPAEPPVAPGVIFWLCMALLGAYALWLVLRRQAWAVALGTRLRQGLLKTLWNRLKQLAASANGYARQVGTVVGERLQRPEPPPAPARTPRLRPLTPGERVRYFYTSTLRRAGQRGLDRRPADTPYEYGARLRNQLPEAAEEIDQLTEAYLSAAYAPRSTTPAEAERAKHPWQRLKRRLKTKQKV